MWDNRLVGLTLKNLEYKRTYTIKVLARFVGTTKGLMWEQELRQIELAIKSIEKSAVK